MRIALVIPTYRRVEYLKLVFRGLETQTRKPDEVVLGVRSEDVQTRQFIEKAQKDSVFPVKMALVKVPGVIASMQAAMEISDGDVICLLDDDAEPLPDWFQRIESAMQSDTRLGAIGGRDLLQDHPEMRRAESTTSQVGIITFYGRVIGNHHRGDGGARYVDILKGCNIAIRAHLIKHFGFEQKLRGQGAQVHWELALFLDIANAKWKISYDPGIRVIHHIAPRLDDDQNHRGVFSFDGLYDMAYNEHFVMAARGKPQVLLAHVIWTVAVGNSTLPGLINFIRCRWMKRDNLTGTRFAAAQRGFLEGTVDGLKVRCDRRQWSRSVGVFGR